MKWQRGLSLTGFLVTAVALIAAVLLVLKFVPPYTEYDLIKRDLTEIVNNPEMANSAGPEIRDAFAKKASIDEIKSISANDIKIDRDNGPFQLGVKYGVKVPLVANVSLWFDFDIKVTRKGSN